MLLRTTVATDNGMSVSYDGAGPQVRVEDLYLPVEFEMSWPGVQGGPDLNIRFAVLDGRPQCREVRVTSPDGGREIRTADTKSIRIDNFIKAASVLAAEHWIDTEGGVTTTVTTNRGADAAEALQTITRARRDSRRRIDDDLLRTTAEVYRAHADANPTKAVAEHFKVKHRTAGDYVRAARDKRFLGEAIKGKAGEKS